MNRRTTARGSSLFLIELIISILFFAVASSDCVQFFVKARLMSREAAQLTEAVSACTTASEAIASGDSLETISDRLRAVYPDCQASLTALSADGGTQTLQLSDELTAVCCMNDRMFTAILHYTPSDLSSPLYTLSVDKYLPGGDL